MKRLSFLLAPENLILLLQELIEGHLYIRGRCKQRPRMYKYLKLDAVKGKAL